MYFAPSQRSEQEEMLDQTILEKKALLDNLRDIRKFNRYLGTRNAILHHIRAHYQKNKFTSFRILDIGCGMADIPLHIANWARNQGIGAEIVAIDLKPEIVEIASTEVKNYPEIRLEVADAFNLSFEPAHFNFVICSQVFHHLPDTACQKLLLLMHEMASTAFIVNDLRRSWLNYYGAHLIGKILNMNYMTRNDAPLSVLRAFTKTEFEQLAHSSGIKNVKCHSYFVHSLQLVGSKI